jgi:hypothetical protein
MGPYTRDVRADSCNTGKHTLVLCRCIAAAMPGLLLALARKGTANSGIGICVDHALAPSSVHFAILVHRLDLKHGAGAEHY